MVWCPARSRSLIQAHLRHREWRNRAAVIPLWTQALWFSLGSSHVPQGPEIPPTCPVVVPSLHLVWGQVLPPKCKERNNHKTTDSCLWFLILLVVFCVLTQVMSSKPGSSSDCGGMRGSWALRCGKGDSGGRSAALKKLVTLENPPNVVAYGSWINLCLGKKRQIQTFYYNNSMKHNLAWVEVENIDIIIIWYYYIDIMCIN